jgi:hypothetical protein
MHISAYTPHTPSKILSHYHIEKVCNHNIESQSTIQPKLIEGLKLNILMYISCSFESPNFSPYTFSEMCHLVDCIISDVRDCSFWSPNMLVGREAAREFKKEGR